MIYYIVPPIVLYFIWNTYTLNIDTSWLTKPLYLWQESRVNTSNLFECGTELSNFDCGCGALLGIRGGGMLSTRGMQYY